MASGSTWRTALDDTISVIDTARAQGRRARFRSAARPTLTPERRGERLFFSARFAFQGHFGCANCHLESTFDGLQWDLEPDGFGKDIVDNRLLEDVADTAPFKWNGGNPNLETECGPRTEKFFYRSESYDGGELADLVSYIKSMPLRPNRYRLAEWRTDCRAGARQGDLRAHAHARTARRFRQPTSARCATPGRTTPTRSWPMWAAASRPTARR